MKKLTKKEILIGNLIDYYANAITASDVLSNAGYPASEKAEKIIATSQEGWDNLPCDTDGATIQQDKNMDNYLNEIAKNIINSYQVLRKLALI